MKTSLQLYGRLILTIRPYRSVVALSVLAMVVAAALEPMLPALLKPLVDQDMSLVFYDLTTIRAAGLSEQVGDVRQYGMAKEGLITRQFMLGVVQTADGLPIYHEVFDGNQAEAPTLIATVQKVLARYAHIKRLIMVADRG